MNAVEIEEAISTLAEQPFDGGPFGNLICPIGLCSIASQCFWLAKG